MTQTTLTIPAITCDHCERTITTALKPLEGIQSIAVDIPSKQVQLEYDVERVDLERIKSILEEENYPVAAVAPVNGATDDRESSGGCSCCTPSD